eukprot:m.45001 g.45001  ORF g.45001 m.45001 type:complete len:382 (-) comp13066_c0_seq1:112-1257(-)
MAVEASTTMSLVQPPLPSASSISRDTIVEQLESIANFRDITQGVEELKSGLIYRCATPSKANQQDAFCLVQQLRLQTIIDFREASEAENDAGECRLKQHFKEVEFDEKSLPQPTKANAKRLRHTEFRRCPATDNSDAKAHGSELAMAPVDADSSARVEVSDTSQSTSGLVSLPEGQVLVRVPYAKRCVMKKVAMSMLKPKHFALIGAHYVGSGLLFKPSLRERGKSVAKKQFNKMGLLGFYKVMLTRSSQPICQVLRICADPRNHPVMLHCSHGKDRTGVTTALLLAILGVPRDMIATDYALSDSHGNSEEGRSRFETECPELDAEEWARAKSDTMIDLLNWVDQEFGSLDLYLDMIDFTAVWRCRLRKVFRRATPSLDFV